MLADAPTHRFSGVGQIFLYNWSFYLAAILFDVTVLTLVAHLSIAPPVRLAMVSLAALAAYWAISSLVISYYVYDRSELYQWDWLANVLPGIPESSANIHAGLDQTSAALQRLFPKAHFRVLDIYAASEMSEPSIRRARRLSLVGSSNESAKPDVLPLANEACDSIFVIFVAHELRSRKAKLGLFRELHRSLKPDGCIILVEHLRDWKNFLAYGPGAFHFFSRREWLAVATLSGLRVAAHRQVTPFVQCFVLSKSSGAGDRSNPLLLSGAAKYAVDLYR